MKKINFIVMILLLLTFSGTCFAEPPTRVAGFVLGGNISDFKDRILMDTAMPIRYREYLKEVEIKNTEGFKSGLIWYGTCIEPNRIIRIKLKYADSSKSFYKKLLKKFKQRYEEPSEWRGDPFHVVIAWKWSFVDDSGDHISMILQHNTMDGEEKMGNALKLTLTDEIEREARCHEKKFPQDARAEKGRPGHKRGKGPPDWDAFIPR